MNKKISMFFMFALIVMGFESRAQIQGGITNPPSLKMYRYMVDIDINGSGFECQSTSLVPGAPEEAFNLDTLRPYLEIAQDKDSSYITDYKIFCPRLSNNRLATVTLVVFTVWPFKTDKSNSPYVSLFLERFTATNWGANDGYFRPSPLERFKVRTIRSVDNRAPLPPRK